MSKKQTATSNASHCSSFRTKYEAADEFDRGVKKAMFAESPEGFDWDTASPLFMAGYHWGRTVRDSQLAAMNAALEANGYKPMGVITLA